MMKLLKKLAFNVDGWYGCQ